MYDRDCEKNITGSRQEALYRICSEGIVQDSDNIYRLEFVFV
jgi:hypothetical protein